MTRAAGASGETYNIGGNSEVRNIDVVDRIPAGWLRKESASTRASSWRSRLRRRSPWSRYLRYAVELTTKVRRTELGWQPEETFETGLEQTVRWYLANAEWIGAARQGLQWVHENYKPARCSMIRKASILAGGSGSRLHPLTRAVSKQLMAVYDKPMIYFPLTTLMLAGIRKDNLGHHHTGGTGTVSTLVGRSIAEWGDWDWSMRCSRGPEGLAAGVSDRPGSSSAIRCALVLGDNLFYGPALGEALARARGRGGSGATVFGSWGGPIRAPTAWPRSTRRVGCSTSRRSRRSRSRTGRSPGSTSTTRASSTRAASLKPSARGELCNHQSQSRAYLRDGALRLCRARRAGWRGSTPAIPSCSCRPPASCRQFQSC